VQVKRLIKALEIIAEGEQELMVKEQEAKEKEQKEKAEKEAKERAEKGLPPLPLDEEEKEKPSKPKEEPKGLRKGDIMDAAAKPPAGAARGGLDEMLKLGGRGSPQNREREGNRFASSHLGPAVQLNTIEEDLHETQTSHYSQAVREGDASERDGSRHNLSNSNHLRNSNALHELEDSARRSANGGPGRSSLPLGMSVHSGDGSGGSKSQTSPPKVGQKAAGIRLSAEAEAKEIEAVEHLEIDEADQRMKDELDAEVDKKYQRQLAGSQDDGYKDEED